MAVSAVTMYDRLCKTGSKVLEGISFVLLALLRYKKSWVSLSNKRQMREASIK